MRSWSRSTVGGSVSRWMETVWLVTAILSFIPANPIADSPTPKCRWRRLISSPWAVATFCTRR